MKRLIIAIGVLACLECASVAAAATYARLDPPTPPPCAADGTCYPNRGEWGYYPVRWRKWPGEELAPTPSTQGPTPSDQLGPDLNPLETPTAEEEDSQAPPPTVKKEQPPAGEAKAPAGEGTGTPAPPAAPPGSAAPERPSYEPPRTAPYGESTSGDLDPPPAIPLSLSARNGSAKTRAAARPTSTSTSSRRPATATDPPPAPPWAFRSAAL